MELISKESCTINGEGFSLYYMCAESLADPGLFNECLLQVPKSRREKVGRYLFRKDKRMSLAAGLLLKEALRDFGLRDDKLSINEHGKPMLLGTDTSFSLSHSSGYAALVIGEIKNSSLGVDIEKIPEKDFLNIARRFFKENELEALESLDSLSGAAKKGGMMDKPNPLCDARMDSFSSAPELFTLIWTRKEAYGKAVGDGLKSALEFDTFGKKTLSRVFFDSFKFPLDRNLVCSICVTNQGQKN